MTSSRLPLSRRFAACFNFVSALAILLAGAAHLSAATVIGSIQDVSALPYGGLVNTIQFTPLSCPQRIGTNTIWPQARTGRLTNGVFNVNLVGGLYYVGLVEGPMDLTPKTVKILVPPNNTNVWQFNDCANLATNLGTFVWTNPPPSGAVTNIDNGGGTNVTLSGSFSGTFNITSGNGLTNNQSGVTLSGAFNGTGTGLTGVTAANGLNTAQSNTLALAVTNGGAAALTSIVSASGSLSIGLAAGAISSGGNIMSPAGFLTTGGQLNPAGYTGLGSIALATNAPDGNISASLNQATNAANGVMTANVPGYQTAAQVAAATVTTSTNSFVTGLKTNGIANVAPGMVPTWNGASMTMSNAPVASAGITNVATGKIAWVDSIFGSNATAILGDASKPSLTISNAVSLATNGCLVWIRPGTYTEHDLAKADVNYHADAGVFIYWMQPTNDIGRGIFDFRGLAASTNVFDMPTARMELIGFTNFQNTAFWDVIVDDGYPFNLSTLGVVVSTNAATKLTGGFGEIGTSMFADTPPVPWAIWIANGNRCNLTVQRIYNPFYGTSIPYYYQGSQFGTFSAVLNGIYWGSGDLTVNCPDLAAYGSTYSIYCHQEVVPSTNDFVFNGDRIAGKIYTASSSLSYKGWFNFKEIDTSKSVGSQSNPFLIQGSGKWYFTGIQKINSITGKKCFVAVGDGTYSNLVVWIDAQKWTSDSGFFDVSAGTVKLGNVPEFEGVFSNSISGNGKIITPYLGVQTNFSGVYFSGNAAGLTNLAIVTTYSVPVAVTVGASAFLFTNKTPTDLRCFVSGGAATVSVGLNGTTVAASLAGLDYSTILGPTEYLTLTYVGGTPTFLTNKLGR